MRYHLPTDDMQALRKGTFHRDPFQLLLCHYRRGIPARYQRSNKQVGLVLHLWQSFDGVDAGSTFALHPPLEPEPLRGALQAEAGKEVLHCRPRKGIGDLQPEGVCGALGEHPFARRRKGDCDVPSTHTVVLRTGGGNTHGQAVLPAGINGDFIRRLCIFYF